jgi:hypothetical protein
MPAVSPSRRKSRVACLAVNADAGTWLCHHCGWRGGLHGRLHACVPPPVPRPQAQPDERKRAALRRMWSEAQQITADDPVTLYLHQRGIVLPLAGMPAVLRHHPHLGYRHEDGQRTYHPTMLARVDDSSGHAVTLHRTYLTIEGYKADVPSVKKLMPSVRPGATRGGAIRLYPAGETLALAGGSQAIEDRAFRGAARLVALRAEKALVLARVDAHVALAALASGGARHSGAACCCGVHACLLRVTLGNVPRGGCLDPHCHCKRTIPRLSVGLPHV